MRRKNSLLKGYDKKVGIRMLVMEMDKAAWQRIGPLMIHLEDTGMLQKICGRRAQLHENGDGRDIGEIIEMQCNKNGHFRYCQKMTYMFSR